MSNHQRKQELQNKVEELESHLKDVRSKLDAIEQQEQHEAIDNLDVLMKQVDDKWKNLSDFWPMVVEELNELFGKDKKQS